jgi:hypothetical protein
MDILYLVDRMEAILNAGQKVPFSSKVMIDEQESMDVLDQMRVVIPEEIKTARRLNQDRERITQQAEAEAGRIIQEAGESAQRLVDDQDIIQKAQVKAQELIARAEQEAEDIRAGADEYALEVLKALESHMQRTIETVRRGIGTLETSIEESQASQSQPD